MYTVSRKMGRKRQKLRSDADDRASVYAGYQRRGKNYGGTDQSGHHLQKTAYQSGKQNLQQNHKSEQQYLIHSVSEKSNMKTFREHLKTQECTEISPDEYQQNNYSPLAEEGVFSTEIKIMCLVSCAA